MMLRRALTAALLTTLATVAAHAATFTWDGGAALDGWHLGANWVGDVAPSSAQTNDVIIPAGSPGGPIIFFSNYKFNSVKSYTSLRIWQDSSLDVSSDSSSSNFGQKFNSILSGTGDFRITGESYLSTQNGMVPVQSGTGRTINDGTLDITLGLNLDGGRHLINNGTLNAAGTIELNGDAKTNSTPGGGQITNNGEFNFIAGSSYAISVKNPNEPGLMTLFHNNSTGTVNHLKPGRASIDALFINDGTLHIGADSAFGFSNTFEQRAASQLIFDIDKANTYWTSPYRSFANLTLGGTLELDATNFYAPKVGDTYTLFAANQHQGAFSTVKAGTGFEGLELAASWSGNSFMVAVVPEPETYAMLLAGLALIGGIARRRKLINS